MNNELNKKLDKQNIAAMETDAVIGVEISDENLDSISGGYGGTPVSNSSIITCPKCGVRYAPAFSRCNCK